MIRNAESPGSQKVLLIGWDGADWEHITPLLDRGLLPTLEKLINGGVMGNLSTLQPVLSPMLWNSVATGKHADQHGILGFSEPDHTHGCARPYSSLSRTSKAIWNILSQNNLKSNVINWWASHPAEKINGCVVSNLFSGVKFDPESREFEISPGTIHPSHLEKPFARFKIFPEELNEAHILPFVPNAAKIDQTQDKRLGALAKTIAETATTQAIATAVMETQPWDFMAVYFTGIDHFAHTFMPFHPPKMPRVTDEEFELYKDVIEGAYRFHDMMLETLLHTIDDSTTVILCSDHGFQSGKYRPVTLSREPAGPVAWHRKYGVFVMNGPNVKKDQRIYGASLIDVGPTVLSLFDLPIGQDMAGRPLLEAFSNTPDVKTIPTWEDVAGPHGMHPAGAQFSASESKELMKQFIALGYIDEAGGNDEKQMIGADCESRYNLARCLLYQSKNDEALKVLQQLSEDFPWETRFITQLAEAYMKCGYLEQARQVIESAFDLKTTHFSQLLLLYAEILERLGRVNDSYQWLLLAEKRIPGSPTVYLEIGQILLRQRQFTDAQRLLEKATQWDPELANAWLALSSVYLRQNKNQLAADTALEALSLLHRLPIAHFNLGVALARSKQWTRSELAFDTALKFSPNMIQAYRMLRYVFLAQGKEDQAEQCYQKLLLLSHSDRQSQTLHSQRRNETFPIPDFGNQAQREARILLERRLPTDPVGESGIEYVVVSGLPRSGTSLMMQMLAAGGITPVSDGTRVADIDNPHGYYEWEGIKQLPLDPTILSQPDWNGHALKVVSPLLNALPHIHRYKVIFMKRPLSEITASQSKMIQRLETDGANLEQEELKRGMMVHLAQVRKWMESQENVDVLEVDYPQLIESPDQVVKQIHQFLGDSLPQPDSMAEAVDQSLYRNRS